MTLESYWMVFTVGMIGGAVLEFLHWWNLFKTNANYPKYAKSPFYWGLTIGMAIVGGLLALFYFGNRTQAILAFHVGLSAPLILQKLVTTVAEPGARAGNETSIVSFFRW
jgi:hypothetical protein|nr:hypothetical protein [Neorhizobium tomejilense]